MFVPKTRTHFHHEDSIKIVSSVNDISGYIAISAIEDEYIIPSMDWKPDLVAYLHEYRMQHFTVEGLWGPEFEESEGDEFFLVCLLIIICARLKWY